MERSVSAAFYQSLSCLVEQHERDVAWAVEKAVADAVDALRKENLCLMERLGALQTQALGKRHGLLQLAQPHDAENCAMMQFAEAQKSQDSGGSNDGHGSYCTECPYDAENADGDVDFESEWAEVPPEHDGVVCSDVNSSLHCTSCFHSSRGDGHVLDALHDEDWASDGENGACARGSQASTSDGQDVGAGVSGWLFDGEESTRPGDDSTINGAHTFSNAEDSLDIGALPTPRSGAEDGYASKWCSVGASSAASACSCNSSHWLPCTRCRCCLRLPTNQGSRRHGRPSGVGSSSHGGGIARQRPLAVPQAVPLDGISVASLHTIVRPTPIGMTAPGWPADVQAFAANGARVQSRLQPPRLGAQWSRPRR